MANTEPEPRWMWQSDKKYVPYPAGDSDLIEVICRTGGTDCEVQDGTATIDILRRLHKDKVTGVVAPIVRATYFWQDVTKEWVPYTENTADVLEKAFQDGQFGIKIALSQDSTRYAIMSPNGTGRHYPGGNAAVRTIRRGWDGHCLPKSKERAPVLPRYPAMPTSQSVPNLIDLAPQQVVVQTSTVPVVPVPGVVQTTVVQQTTQAEPAQPGPVRRTSSVGSRPARTDGVIREGYVSKKSGRVFIWKERWLVLTREFLGVYVDRTKEKAKVPVARITRAEQVKANQGASGTDANSAKNDNCHFNVFSLSGHTYHFRAASPDDAADWCEAIMTARFGEKKPEQKVVTTTTTTTTAVPPADPALITVSAPAPQVVAAPSPVPIGSFPPQLMPGQPMMTSPAHTMQPQMMPGQPMPMQGQSIMTAQGPMQMQPQMMPGQPPMMSGPQQMPGQPQMMPGQPMPMQPQYMTQGQPPQGQYYQGPMSPPQQHMSGAYQQQGQHQMMPMQMQGQPQMMTGQPMQMQGQPQVMTMQGQPQMMPGQPQMMPGQPPIMTGQPQMMQGQPQMHGQYPMMQGQPMQMQGQPMMMQGQPMQMQGQPMQMQGQPMQMMPQYQQQYHYAQQPQQPPVQQFSNMRLN